MGIDSIEQTHSYRDLLFAIEAWELQRKNVRGWEDIPV
jgi:hypothetical protein